MWKDFWALTLDSPDFVWIFIAALVVLGIQTAVKFITKLPVLLNEPTDPIACREAKFDVLRLGLDLSLVGLVAACASFLLAVSKAGQSDIGRLSTYQLTFVLFQFLLLLAATIFTTMFSSAERSYKRGIWIPTLIGFFSVYCAAIAFRLQMLKAA